MKKFISIIIALAATVAFISCTKENPEPEQPADTASGEFQYTNNYGHTLLAGTLDVETLGTCNITIGYLDPSFNFQEVKYTLTKCDTTIIIKDVDDLKIEGDVTKTSCLTLNIGMYDKGASKPSKTKSATAELFTNQKFYGYYAIFYGDWQFDTHDLARKDD